MTWTCFRVVEHCFVIAMRAFVFSFMIRTEVISPFSNGLNSSSGRASVCIRDPENAGSR